MSLGNSEVFQGSLFETTPVPMLLEDWSVIKRRLLELRAAGVDDSIVSAHGGTIEAANHGAGASVRVRLEAGRSGTQPA